jgi:hypothetical protein
MLTPACCVITNAWRVTSAGHHHSHQHSHQRATERTITNQRTKRMRLDFCVACGVRDALHHHHLTPRTEGGPDDETNLITLCEDRHGRVHGRTFKHHRKLQRVGIERARLAGVYKGRGSDMHQQGLIIFFRIMGLGATEIATHAGCKRGNGVGVDPLWWTGWGLGGLG